MHVTTASLSVARVPAPALRGDRAAPCILSVAAPQRRVGSTARARVTSGKKAAGSVRCSANANVNVAAVAPQTRETSAWSNAARAARLTHLEAQAMDALQLAVDNFKSVAFPCALIAGDVVILHLLHRMGYLSTGKVKVIFIDTFHLFPETLQFLRRLEAAFSFQAETFHIVDCATKADYDAKYGADLWKKDIDKYDKMCKVEPFSRALKTLAVDAMINGRRRDHGFERAHLEVWEDKGGPSVSVQPLAYWEFRDCFAYLDVHGVEAHPLHAQGYPSIGDLHSTVPVAREKWFEYAGERSGRFQGLTDKDGKPKTECGIHVDGSKRQFDRDLWEQGSGVEEVTVEQYQQGALKGKDTILVVYAPWCPFCQKMEAEFVRFAKGVAGQGVAVAKLRGDLDRETVREAMDVQSFPTVLAFSKGGAGAEGKAFTKYASEERAAEDFLAFANKALGAKLEMKK